MQRTLRGLALACLSALVLAVPALAHVDDGDHATPPDPAAGTHSQNMKHLANIPSLGPTNSDLAFSGRYLYAGNYGGFRVVDIADPEHPVVVADVRCAGPQNDISVYGSLLVLSVDEVRTSPGCNSARANPQTSETGWEGLRLFDVSNLAGPRYIGSVYTDCGSHTHTLVPDPGNGRVFAYVASYPLRAGPSCGPHDDPSDDHDPLHRKISVVEIPLANPAAAHVVSQPKLNVPTWSLLAEMFPGSFFPLQACHDIQVDLRTKLAAGACASVGQLWDISDPANPKTETPLWTVDAPEVQFYHSALFSEDRETVIFGDEIIAGHCSDGTGSGQLWFHEAQTGVLQSSFQIPRHQGGAYCSAHLFNNIPGVRNDVLVSSWYAGGVTVVDFTDRSAPKEIGYYDPQGGSAWAGYWYNNFIYTNDIPRGIDVFLFSDRARAGATRLPYLNPQVQE